LGGPKTRDHWEDLGVGGRIILRWTSGRWYQIFEKYAVCFIAVFLFVGLRTKNTVAA
jgi:hypothetical protein